MTLSKSMYFINDIGGIYYFKLIAKISYEL